MSDTVEEWKLQMEANSLASISAVIGAELRETGGGQVSLPFIPQK